MTVPLLEANKSLWQQRLFGIVSEWSPQFPGHLAGVIDAATRGVERMLSARQSDMSLKGRTETQTDLER